MLEMATFGFLRTVKPAAFWIIINNNNNNNNNDNNKDFLIDNKITGHFISFHCALDTKIKIWKSTKKNKNNKNVRKEITNQ